MRFKGLSIDCYSSFAAETLCGQGVRERALLQGSSIPSCVHSVQLSLLVFSDIVLIQQKYCRVWADRHHHNCSLGSMWRGG